MNKGMFARAVEEAIALQMKAIDIVVNDIFEPMVDFGSPEKMIGKPYELWQPEDFQRAATIFGQAKDSKLNHLIFRKKYEYVTTLEQEGL